MRIAAERGWPLPGSIVVNRANVETGSLAGSSRSGFIAAARELGLSVGDPEIFVKEQQERMFEWAVDAPEELELPGNGASPESDMIGPQFVRYFGPVLDALRALGGSAKPLRVRKKVIELAAVKEEVLEETTKGGQPKFENQVAWARFYLFRAGLIDDKVRGTWALTAALTVSLGSVAMVAALVVAAAVPETWKARSGNARVGRRSEASAATG